MDVVCSTQSNLSDSAQENYSAEKLQVDKDFKLPNSPSKDSSLIDRSIALLPKHNQEALSTAADLCGKLNSMPWIAAVIKKYYEAEFVKLDTIKKQTNELSEIISKETFQVETVREEISSSNNKIKEIEKVLNDTNLRRQINLDLYVEHQIFNNSPFLEEQYKVFLKSELASIAQSKADSFIVKQLINFGIIEHPVVYAFSHFLKAERKSLSSQISDMQRQAEEKSTIIDNLRKKIVTEELPYDGFNIEFVEVFKEYICKDIDNSATALSRIIEIGNRAHRIFDFLGEFGNILKSFSHLYALLNKSSSEKFQSAYDDYRNCLEEKKKLDEILTLESKKVIELQSEMEDCSDSSKAINAARSMKLAKEQIAEISDRALPGMLVSLDRAKEKYLAAQADEEDRLQIALDPNVLLQFNKYIKIVFGDELGAIISENNSQFLSLLISSIHTSKEALQKLLHSEVFNWIKVQKLNEVNDYSDRQTLNVFLESGGRAAVFSCRSACSAYCTDERSGARFDNISVDGPNLSTYSSESQRESSLENKIPYQIMKYYWCELGSGAVFRIADWGKRGMEFWAPLPKSLDDKTAEFVLRSFSKHASWSTSYRNSCDVYSAWINIDAKVLRNTDSKDN